MISLSRCACNMHALVTAGPIESESGRLWIGRVANPIDEVDSDVDGNNANEADN